VGYLLEPCMENWLFLMILFLKFGDFLNKIVEFATNFVKNIHTKKRG
jgi:hypothetical protein